MKALRILSLTLLLTVTTAAVASAQDYARMGAYVRGGVTIYFENSAVLDGLRDSFGVMSSTDTFIGGEGALGYRVHPYFAVEGEFEYLGSADETVAGITAGTIKLWDVTANAKAYPFTGRIPDRFQPFAVIGLGYGAGEITWTPAAQAATGNGLTNVDEGGFVAKFGGGIDIYITESIAVYVDGNYLLTTGDIQDNDVGGFGAGAMFRF